MTADEIFEEGTVNVATASRLTGLGPEKLRSMIRGGEIRASQIGNRWLIPRVELRRVLSSHLAPKKRRPQTLLKA